MDLTFHLNSMPLICGSLETTDSTAHAISRFECGRDTEKFKPFIRTASSHSLLFRKIPDDGQSPKAQYLSDKLFNRSLQNKNSIIPIVNCCNAQGYK
jgi:hypothetical protein